MWDELYLCRKLVISVNYGFGGGDVTDTAKSSAESGKFTLKIRSESGKLLTNGRPLPPKLTNFGTLQTHCVRASTPALAEQLGATKPEPVRV